MGRTNKYHDLLSRILATGKVQENKKGSIKYLLDERLCLTPADLLEIFEGHGIARKKLKNELGLFMQGERDIEKYREAGISWWDYCGSMLINSYPTYFKKLPPLIAKINRERRNSKNYVLFLGGDRRRDQPSPLPEPYPVPDRRRRTGAVRLPAQFGCQSWTACRHLSLVFGG